MTAVAISWSVAMGLFPGYYHNNNPAQILEKRALLMSLWKEAMNAYYNNSGFMVSCIITDGVVLYPEQNGCPPHGETVVILSGSSNPDFVVPGDLNDFMTAVENIIKFVQRGMGQTTCRIEFQEITRSVYSRL